MKKFLFILILFCPSLGYSATGNSPEKGNNIPKSQHLAFGDPYILADNGTYYMYGTSSDEGIEVYKSTDLTNWEGPCGSNNGFALRKEDVWGDKMFWAPEVYKVNNKYYMFFSVEEHIAVAISNSPTGPFVQEKQQPLLETKAIDSHLYMDGNGKKYLYYVAFTNGNVIWMCEMIDDLLSIKPNTIKECFGRSQSWEFSPKEPVGTVNEGPFIIKKNETYYMIYSANHYASQDYGIGYATATSPEGPWVKYTGNPILQSPDTLKGTGHCSLFQDKDGKLSIVYHAHNSQTKVHPRLTYINRCEFVTDSGSGTDILTISAPRIVPQLISAFTNPLFDGADPWVTLVDGYYYWCSSENNKIEISKSKILTQKGMTKSVWSAPDTGWNRNNIWAPELHFFKGKWYIYYAGGKEGPPFIHQKSGVLESKTSDPQGEYIDRGMLNTGTNYQDPKTNIWAIDANMFEFHGQLYIVWSGWEKPADTDKTSQHLYIAPMSNPYTISGPRVKISSPLESWETGGPLDLNEGPEVLKHGNDLFIIYSCRESWLKEYRLGQLRLKSNGNPLDPKSWIKSGPVFQGTDKVLGVGHASFTTSRDGKENWIVYHSKKSETPGWERDVRIQKFEWKPDGSPNFGIPLPAGTPMERSSGENSSGDKK